MAIADIVTQLTLDPESIAALAEPGLRSGRLGMLLTLTERLEANDAVAAHATLQHLPGLDLAGVNTGLSQALAWANNIGRET
jgi:c-di-GMP-related signal transduction protein